MNDELWEYLAGHCQPEPELLRRLDRETNLKVPYPNMLTGHLQGRFLAFISGLLKPKKVLEIGTYTGYSALCLAEGIAGGGSLITIDNNPEVEDIAMRYFREAGFENTISRLQGNALEILPTINETFDLIYLDADKENYPRYLSLCKEKLNPDGLLMADNTLWGGKVLEPGHPGDQETAGIKTFNRMVKDDPAIDALILPLRDGITLIRWKTAN